MIDFDVETDGFQHYAGHRPFLAQFYSPERLGPEPIVLEVATQRDQIQALLDLDDDYRAWNSKFDLHHLDAAGFRLPPSDRWHDGMVAAHLLDERRSVALQAVGNALFGAEAAGASTEAEVKGWLKEENARRRKESKKTGEEYVPATYAEVPREIMVPYAAHDVVLGRQVGDVQDAALANTPELQELYQLEMEVMAALFDAEKAGLPVDEGAARLLEMDLAATLEELELESRVLAGIDTFNPRSSKQLYEALQRRGANLRFVTGTSMDAENLATVDDPLARLIESHRATSKLLGTYVRPMLHGKYEPSLNMFKQPFIQDGRIHSNIRQVGAGTGRMSSADPNIQNFPRDDLRLRYLVRAEPGHVLVTADLDSIELKLFAAYTSSVGGGRLLEMARDPDADPHTATADFVGLGDFVRSGGAVESRRQRGKTFNYSILYGAGVNSVRKHFRVDQKTARRMIDDYHRAYPEVGRLQRLIESKLYEVGYVKSAYGRRFRVDPRQAYKATNYLVQGTAADMLKVAIARLRKEGIPIVAPVHDELVAHVRKEDAEEVAHALTQALTDHPRITQHVPLGAEAKIVHRWSEAKDPSFVLA